MKKIKHAKFLRSIETNAATMAEVEFAWEGDFGADDGKDAPYVAVLRKEGDNDYSVDRIIKKLASREIDWFDNSEHDAYRDVTDEVFSQSQTGVANGGSAHREQFVKDVLAHEGICEDMACRGLSSVFK